MNKILFAEKHGVQILKFVGDVQVALCPTINTFLEKVGRDKKQKAIVIDLNETTHIDSTSLGLLANIALKSIQFLDAKPTLISSNEDITRVIHSMGFDEIFVIVEQSINSCDAPTELPTSVVSESAMREQVLEAHKILMSLNEGNEACFCNLVEALEKECESESIESLGAGPLKSARG